MLKARLYNGARECTRSENSVAARVISRGIGGGKIRMAAMCTAVPRLCETDPLTCNVARSPAYVSSAKTTTAPSTERWPRHKPVPAPVTSIMPCCTTRAVQVAYIAQRYQRKTDG